MGKNFRELNSKKQVRLLHQLALNALAGYDLKQPKLELIIYGMNTVFRVTDVEDQQKYVLRIPPQMWLDHASFVSETDFLRSLQAQPDLCVVKPVQNLAGEYVQTGQYIGVPGERSCILFEWIDHRFFRDIDRLDANTLTEMGRTLALLHQYGQTFSPPSGFHRPTLDMDGLFGENGLYDPKGRLSMLTQHQQSVIMEAQQAIGEKLNQLDRNKETFGLIHSDYYYRNLFVTKEKSVGVIDFDMCGYGYYLFDLVIPFWPFRQGNHIDAYEHFLRGYRMIRPVPEGFYEYRPIFEAIRRLIDAYFYVQRDDSAVFQKMWRFMSAYAVAELKKFLKNETRH